MSTSFTRINWGDEPITSDKLNDMVENDNYLFENTLSGFYDALGIIRDSGLTYRCGYINSIKTESLKQTIAFYYSKPFMPGARPVIITGEASSGLMAIFHAVRGLDNRAVPDHRGFNMIMSQYKDTPQSKFDGSQVFSYFAIAPTS